MWVAVGMIGAAVIGGVATNMASDTAAGAADNASNLQYASAAASNNLQQQQFDRQQANIQPWITAGTGALNTLSAGTQPGGQFSTTPQFQFDPTKVQYDPGYNFRYQQGVNSLSAAGAAAGNLGSGNMGTALVNYGQQAGSQEYMNAYTRAYQQQMDQYNSQVTGQNTIFNRLSGIAGTGQTANTQLMSAGQNYANAVSNNLMTSAANAGSFGMQGAQIQANNWNNIGSQVGQVANQLGNYFTNQNALSAAQWGPGSGPDTYGTLYSNDMSLTNASMNDWGG